MSPKRTQRTKAEPHKSTKRREGRRTVTFVETQLKRLQALAERQGTDVNCQIQIAVSKHLDAADEELLQRSKSITEER